MFVYFSGINISNLEYLNNSKESQEFKCEYQLGFSEMKLVNGIFKNEYELTESELRNILYLQTNRKELKEIEITNHKEIIYSYKNKKFSVLFKN